jgi:hypothetical protein
MPKGAIVKEDTMITTATTTMNSFIPPFEHFNCEVEAFESYLERFECHTDIYNINDEKKV